MYRKNGLFTLKKKEYISSRPELQECKGASSGKRKIIPDGKLDLCKGKVMKSARSYKYVDKYILLCFYIGYLSMCAQSWTIACQTSLSMKFSRQEYCSVLPFPALGDLPDQEIGPTSLASPSLADRFFTTAPPGKPRIGSMSVYISHRSSVLCGVCIYVTYNTIFL